jgi:multidrug efflux pump subunit AcrA (membrane-fusion protein)
MSLKIDFSFIPSNIPSICIPYVFETISNPRIMCVFREMNIGIIERIEKNNYTSQQQQNLDNLRQEHQNTLQDYENLLEQINGTVTSISYKDGELVAPQAEVVTVTNLEHLFLEVSLEQQSILRVKKDQPVYISFESLRNEKCEGLVTSVYPRENQFIVRIELKKWPLGVLPGMTADVAILVGKKSNALLIPINSIFAGQVTRIRHNKKERVPVKLGIIDGEWGEVVSDNILETDELIIRK